MDQKANIPSPDPGNSSNQERPSTPRSNNTVNGFIFQGIPASPPKFVSLEEVIKAAHGVTNMVLAHEIAVDKDFVLTKPQPPEDSLEHRVKSIVHKAFWDLLEEQLKQDPPCYDQALNLLSEIKQVLLEDILLPSQTKMRTEITETLDLPLIKQQLEHGALDFLHYANWLVSVLGKLVAPARDAKVQELTTITEVVPLFRGIMEVLELTKLDIANFTLQQIRPQVQLHSIEYERHKFQEFLETQAAMDPTMDGLEFTKQWLRRNFNKLIIGGSQPTVQQVLNKAYMELLEWDDQQMFPETLLMDQARFLALRDQVRISTLVASILLITYNNVNLQASPELKASLKQHVSLLLQDNSQSPSALNSQEELEEKLKSVGEQVVKEISEIFNSHENGIHLEESTAKSIKDQIYGLRNAEHPVRALVRSRILAFISEVISLSSDQKIKIPVGLSSLQAELSKITGQLVRLISHNRAVFGDYYTTIIEGMLVPSDTALHPAAPSTQETSSKQ